MQLTQNTKITQVVDQSEGAAGTADITGDSVDMQGWDGVVFICVMGAITASAVTSIHAEQSADDSSFADLAGTNQAIADDADEEVFVIDIYKPIDRYVRPIVDRATQNAAVQTVLAIQYQGSKSPVAAHGTGVNVERFVSPAEGTI